MSDGRPLHLVDVFAERKYAGNQLAVVRRAGDLADDEMQAIAREMNYSETTFVESPEPGEGGWDVRIFTPENELPFAGHPTLGTAHVVREALAEGRPDEVRLNLGVGQIPVTVEDGGGNGDGGDGGDGDAGGNSDAGGDGDGGGNDDGDGDAGGEVLWMTQQPPTFGAVLDPGPAAAALGLDPADLDAEFPARVVSTGLPTLVVPVQGLDAVRRAGTVRDPYYEHVVDGAGAENLLCFAPETVRDDNDLHVRVFAEVHGVPEDPATGSSNGCLAAYLARERYLGGPEVEVRVEQGYEMDRPSLLYLRAADRGEAVSVRVGGSVVPVADGTLR